MNMKIKSFKKLKDNRYKIKIENEEDIILYDDIILKYGLLLTKKITEKELNVIQKENTSLECYYKAIKYLAGKNRSKKEVISYLKRFQYESKDIDYAIMKLEEKNYLNEDNYLTAYINDQIHLTNNGPLKIKRKLIDLGLTESDIDIKLNQVDNKIWQEKLEKIINKKVSSNKKDGANKIKEKILYNCINEGFKKEDILNILEKIQMPNNSNALEKEANKLYIKLSRKYENKELYFQLKGKLLTKGFEFQEIEEVIDKIKKTSN